MATPLTRLNRPKAVPRKSAGAVSATMVANKPCVMPMCTPHKATPINRLTQSVLTANTASAKINTNRPATSKRLWLTRSDNQPNG